MDRTTAFMFSDVQFQIPKLKQLYTKFISSSHHQFMKDMFVLHTKLNSWNEDISIQHWNMNISCNPLIIQRKFQVLKLKQKKFFLNFPIILPPIIYVRFVFNASKLKSHRGFETFLMLFFTISIKTTFTFVFIHI